MGDDDRLNFSLAFCSPFLACCYDYELSTGSSLPPSAIADSVKPRVYSSPSLT